MGVRGGRARLDGRHRSHDSHEAARTFPKSHPNSLSPGFSPEVTLPLLRSHLKSGMPVEVEMPAPVKAKTRAPSLETWVGKGEGAWLS